MHRELISMHRERSYIVSQYPCIAKDYVSRVNIHASQKIMHRESISMHHRKSCTASQYTCIRKTMHHDLISKHRKKISYLAEIYASGEDFIPHRNLHIAKRYSCPARNHTLLEKEIVHPKRNIYPLTSTAFFYFDKSKHQEEYQRRRQEKYQHCVSFYIFLHQMK